jgi:hypothetical protein
MKGFKGTSHESHDNIDKDSQGVTRMRHTSYMPYYMEVSADLGMPLVTSPVKPQFHLTPGVGHPRHTGVVTGLHTLNSRSPDLPSCLALVAQPFDERGEEGARVTSTRPKFRE